MSAKIKTPRPASEENNTEAPRYCKATAARDVRVGWAESMKEMAARGDDRLFLKDSHQMTEWEANEWDW